MQNFLSIPNFLSSLRILLTLVVILFLARGKGYIYWALIIFTIAILTDYYDGYMARKLNQSSPLGAFLDPLADKVLVLGLFVAFYLFDYMPFWIVLVIIMRDIFVTYMRALANYKGVILKTSKLAKWKTTSQFALIYVIMFSMAFNQIPAWISAFIYAVLAITLYSLVDYLLRNKQLLAKSI